MPKTAEEMAAEVDNELGAGGDGGDAGAEGGGDGGGGSEGADAGDQGADEDFKDEDLEPAAIEALSKATKPLDNAGILKRLSKIHSRMKAAETWKKERETWATDHSRVRLKDLDRFMGALTKFRSADAQDKEGALEVVLGRLMEGEFKDLGEVKAALDEMLGAAAKPPAASAPEDAKYKALETKLAALERARNEDSQAKSQLDLNQKIDAAFRSVPKLLSAKPEFKDLPWKDQKFMEEFDGLLEEKYLAWATKNEDKLQEGELPPTLDLAQAVAKLFIRGGSIAMKKQVVGPDGKRLALTRSAGPGGASPRKLPKKDDDQSEVDYLTNLAKEVEAEMGA